MKPNSTHTESFAAFQAKKDQARAEQEAKDKAALDKRDAKRNGPRRQEEIEALTIAEYGSTYEGDPKQAQFAQ